MRNVHPEVFLVARPQLDYDALAAYLAEVGGSSWLERLDQGHLDNDALNLAEFAGRPFYRSLEAGPYPNVAKSPSLPDADLPNSPFRCHRSRLRDRSLRF